MVSREEQDLEVDIEAGRRPQESTSDSVFSANDLNNPLMGAETSLDLSEQKSDNVKFKKSSRKASSKPPRPPKGPTLSANDHKFMKEITELAKRKRARIERMRNSLRRMKTAKSSSSSSSSPCISIFSMIVTILFFGFLIFQGFFAVDSSLSLDNSPAPIGSPSNNQMISVQFYNEFAPVEQTNPSPSTSFRYTRKRVSGGEEEGEESSRDFTR